MKVYLLKTDLNTRDDCFNSSQSIVDGLIGDGRSASSVKIQGNIVDHDLFICDLDLVQGWLSVRLVENQHILAQRIATGGVLLCFAGKVSSAKNSANNYTWLKHLGADVGPENLPGSEVRFETNLPFIDKLNNISRNFFHNVIFNKNPGGVYTRIANNKSEHAIAFYAPYQEGHVFILPRPKEKSTFVEYFIENILPTLELNFDISSGSKEPMPEEISKISVKGQDVLRQKIGEQKELIEAEQVKLSKLEEDYSNLEQWKDLLWQTGLPLEIAVKRFFALLGLELDTGETDLIGEYDDREVFIEVKGKSGCIDHKHDFRQILQRKTIDANDPSKALALLVGNPFRLNPLDQRPPDDNSLFAKTSVSIAKDNGIGLVHTLEMFQAVNDILADDSISRKKMLENVLYSAGVYKYKK